jgi:hypothetical protein
MFLYLFYFFVFYLLFRLVVNFIIPVVRTTHRIRKGFQAMKDQMAQGPGAAQQPGAEQKPDKGKNVVGDYIDFEEV